jgi:hypothetical protein
MTYRELAAMIEKLSEAQKDCEVWVDVGGKIFSAFDLGDEDHRNIKSDPKIYAK